MGVPHRLDFFDMPPKVVAAIEAAIGASVTRAENADGGFTPGPASRCELSDGRRLFIKACSDDLSELASFMHRREATVLAALPTDFPAPNFVASVDLDGWIIVVSEQVDGAMPPVPLDSESIHAVLRLVAELAERGATCPIVDLDRVGAHPQEWTSRWAWKKLMDDGAAERLDPWSRRHLPKLVELEDEWIAAARGEALLHRDFRTDNIILGEDRAVAVDWPVASRGAPWVDLVGLLPSFHMNGAPEPTHLFEQHPVGAAAEPAAVDCYLASLAGYFTRQALLAPLRPGTGLRELQSEQGNVCRSWLASRTGWE